MLHPTKAGLADRAAQRCGEERVRQRVVLAADAGAPGVFWIPGPVALEPQLDGTAALVQHAPAVVDLPEETSAARLRGEHRLNGILLPMVDVVLDLQEGGRARRVGGVAQG